MTDNPLKLYDGDGTAYYVDAEGAGSSGDPAKLRRVLLGGYGWVIKEIVRPADTTQYSALDCLAASTANSTTQNLPLAGRKVGGTGAINTVAIKTDNPNWTNSLNVLIYDRAAPVSFYADNAAFDTNYSNADNVACHVMLPSFTKVTGGAGSYAWAVTDNLNRSFECAADSQNLYFQIYVPSGTPTPLSGQKFKVIVGLMRD